MSKVTDIRESLKSLNRTVFREKSTWYGFKGKDITFSNYDTMFYVAPKTGNYNISDLKHFMRSTKLSDMAPGYSEWPQNFTMTGEYHPGLYKFEEEISSLTEKTVKILTVYADDLQDDPNLRLPNGETVSEYVCTRDQTREINVLFYPNKNVMWAVARGNVSGILEGSVPMVAVDWYVNNSSDLRYPIEGKVKKSIFSRFSWGRSKPSA